MTILRGTLVLVLLGVVGHAAYSADGYADGWTQETLAEAIGACSNELNERTWKNTLRDQGIDPATAMPPEIRRALEPQIAAAVSASARSRKRPRSTAAPPTGRTPRPSGATRRTS
jgi:hypothetical protein